MSAVTVKEFWFLKPESWAQALEVMQEMDEIVGPPAHQDAGWRGHARFYRGETPDEPVLMIYPWQSKEAHRELTAREEPLLADFFRRHCTRPRRTEYLEELPVDTGHDEHAPPAPDFSLEGKSAVVTGASRGIGRAIAIRLARGGADVLINYRSDEAAARKTAEAVANLGRKAVLAAGDVTLVETASQLVAEATARFGRLDVVVNNTGPFIFKPLDLMTHAEWDHVLQSNLSSAHFLSQAALPALRESRGCIINLGLAPVHRVRAAPHVAAYAIAKTGVVILTRSLAIEQARFGVRVNCVSPGLIDTGYLPAAQKVWMEKRVPMGRLGTPEEVAEAVHFLASPAASYISGANLAVAGAWDWEDRPTDHDDDVKGLFEGGQK